MFRLIKYAGVMYFFKRYKKYVITILIAILAFLLIDYVYNQIHSYYMQLNDEEYQQISSYIFWSQLGIKAALILIIMGILYLAFKPTKTVTDDKKRVVHNKLEEKKPKVNNPFEHIRTKKKLDSKADKIFK